MILPAFTYRVDIRGAVHQDNVANGVDGQDQVNASLKSAQLFVDGVQRPQGWLSNFAQAERDLLRVAAAVLDLDRLSLRRPRNTRSEKRELHWRRVFTVEIAVEDPARWRAVSEELHALLSFLTDDIWTFTFLQGERFREQYVLFAPDISPDAEIALFSGGLDSSVGLLARHRENGRSFVSVSAVGNEVRRRAQDAALAVVRRLGVAVTPIRIDHQLKDADRALEISQRTRGLFFLAIGAAVASQIGNRQFHVYETGVGCLNIPTSAAQIASQGTRAMHPHTLAMFEAPTGGDVTVDVACSRTVEMYRRYAAEIRRFLAAAPPTLRPRDPHPAKEVARDLFAADR